jgi:pyrroline-5-carboxylate reductase
MAAKSLAFLGGGNMGRALVSGLLRRGIRQEQIRVAEVSADAQAALRRDLGISASEDLKATIADADVVVLAVKPQEARAVLTAVAALLQQKRPLVVSVAAGIRVESLVSWCGAGIAVVRAMPNRPAFVGAGVSGLYAPHGVSAAAREDAAGILRAVGEVVWVADEEALDVVTALSGSGPAYLFLLSEAMMQAGVALGLDPEAARRLAVGTLCGAGLLAQSSDGDLARLRQEVTSQGGTTEAALAVFAAADFSATVTRALTAAMLRSREIAAQFG